MVTIPYITTTVIGIVYVHYISNAKSRRTDRHIDKWELENVDKDRRTVAGLDCRCGIF